MAGRAAPLISRPDVDVVAIASPGMDVDDSRLHTSARVWAMRGEDDPIVWVLNVRVGTLGHGNDPTARSFGATRLATGTATGHTGYFAPGTTALTNLAEVVLGRPQDATTQEPS